MDTVNQPSSQPTNKITAASLAAAAIPAMGLIIRNLAPEWYDPELMLAMAPIAVYLFGYFIKDEPNVTLAVEVSK